MMLSHIIIFIISSWINLSSAEQKPNILVIIADDLGWANVGYHNKENDEIQTPFIDELVANGLELNRHYTYYGCSPSRTSFQTGRLPVHVNTNNQNEFTHANVGIPLEMTTIASKLQTAGYGTHLIGKWDCGMSTYDHLPRNKGYNTFYGYLGKSIYYFSKITYQQCGNSVVDLWEDDEPAFKSADEIDSDRFVEYIFAEKVKDLITSYQDSDDPFFITYSMHLPHFPVQVPEEHLLEAFEEDESYCSGSTESIFPGFEQSALFHCRSALQSQVALMDNIVGSIAETLKSANLWDDTLIVFTSDNGGSLEINETAGNNWPLRGGKTSSFEGGVRTTAFVSGGYLPSERSGEVEEGLMHVADWYTTFCSLAGVESMDADATNHGLPDVDGLDMWPLISGQVEESPRSELAISIDTFIWNNYKLMTSSHKYAIWTSPMFPNSSSQSQTELKYTTLACDDDGCLFDVVNDPSEYTDLSNLEEYSDIMATMKEKLQEVKENLWENEEFGIDLCPDNATYDISWGSGDCGVNVSCCGCWMALHEYGGFIGPYQTPAGESVLVIEEKSTMELMVEKLNDYIYFIVLPLGCALLLAMMKYCYKSRQEAKLKRMEMPSYGTLQL